MSEFHVIRQVDEKFAPPTQPVLVVSVIGNEAVLEVATMTDDHKTTTLTKVHCLVVPVAELDRALHAGCQDFLDRRAMVASGEAQERKTAIGRVQTNPPSGGET